MLIEKKNYVRDKAFRRWISTLPCIRCGKQGTQAAHLEKGGRGIKGGDDSCRPLCAASFGDEGCHSRLDQNKDQWWTRERKRECLDLPVYENWKAGELEKAVGLILGFKCGS